MVNKPFGGTQSVTGAGAYCGLAVPGPLGVPPMTMMR